MADSTENINDNILSRLDDVSDDTDVHIEQKDEKDEFEELLSSFIASEKSDTDSIKGDTAQNKVSELQAKPVQSQGVGALGSDEAELAQAYQNFVDAVVSICVAHEIDTPELSFDKSLLVPNYKPSIGKLLVTDTLKCWDILFATYPDQLSTLNPNSSDEQFLNFAEGLSDQNLQLAIISYVEILIDIENCEISYEERRLKSQRKRIEKALYEEYQYRQARKLKFIEAVQKRNFPIDAERLINNYFKTATKDPKAAFKALTNNPAMFSPIQNEKIKPRFFGLLKVTPEDGIRENHKIGVFLKKLKV